MSRVLIPILLISAVILAQTAKKPMSDSASQKFAQLEDGFIKESLALSPVSASAAGLHKYTDPKSGKVRELDAELDDVSPQAISHQLAFYRGWRQRFQREAPLAGLGREDAADWRLLDDQMALALLDLERIHSFKHNPTGYVELVGNALFLPMTQDYAPKEVRMGHVLARVEQIPRALAQARQVLTDAPPIWAKVAVEENAGNVDLIENTIREQVAGTPLEAKYKQVAPPALDALRQFSAWLEKDLRKTSPDSWRLGKERYDAKFRLVMETEVTPEQVLADAERDLKQTRAEMLAIALPLHRQWFPQHGEHSELAGRERENRIISEVLDRIGEDHVPRGQLRDEVTRDVAEISRFLRAHKLVSMSPRDNLKVVATPVFMRGVFSVGGFHPAPPLEPNSEAQYWVTPIAAGVPEAKAESRLREYNNWTLKWLTLHEALPGHYLQFEHADNVQPMTRRLARALFGNGPYVEGWAEYGAQKVMRDARFQNNDPRYLMVVDKIMLRDISNVILDVRMQTMNMTDAQAVDLMTKEVFQTQAEADGKLQRAKLTSTQLPTYYVGYHEWLALRKRYEAAMGAKFNLMEFHDRALGEGALPLPLLEKIILPRAVAD